MTKLDHLRRTVKTNVDPLEATELEQGVNSGAAVLIRARLQYLYMDVAEEALRDPGTDRPRTTEVGRSRCAPGMRRG